MFGTLVGIFITSTAIVIGADSMISQDDGTTFSIPVPGKTCQTGPASVATIQGHYLIELMHKTTEAWLFNSFRQMCTTRPRMKVLLEEQANILIEDLRAQLQKRLISMDKAYLDKRFGRNSHVNYVSVSGYENGKPRVEVRELTLNRTQDGQWRPRVVGLRIWVRRNVG